MAAGPGRIAEPGEVLAPSFYDRPVTEVATDLVGCTVRCRGTAGVIIEVEAYHEREPACHAFRGRTARTDVLYRAPGTAYVYFTYGMHWLLNAVAEPVDTAAAVLIRALVPSEGTDLMRQRRERLGRTFTDRQLCSGPAKLVEALDVRPSDNGSMLTAGDPQEGPVIVWDPMAIGRLGLDGTHVVAGERIGISEAVELPWRYGVDGSRFLSRQFVNSAGTVGRLSV